MYAKLHARELKTLLRSKSTFIMNTHRLKKGFLIATFCTFGSPKSRHVTEWARAGKDDDHVHLKVMCRT